jgi:hypothetical protein
MRQYASNQLITEAWASIQLAHDPIRSYANAIRQSFAQQRDRGRN